MKIYWINNYLFSLLEYEELIEKHKMFSIITDYQVDVFTPIHVRVLLLPRIYGTQIWIWYRGQRIDGGGFHGLISTFDIKSKG